MALLFYYPTFDYCYVSNILTVGSEPVISFFNKGKSFFGDLPFLHFCNKCDICNQHELTSGCCFGKKSQVLTRPFFVRYSQCICN
jgi:hypothetical protein